MKKHFISKPKLALLVCLCGVAITAYARTVERLADGTIGFQDRFDGPAVVFVDKITLEPGEVTPYHFHRGDSTNVVTEGILTLRNRCSTPQHFVAGDAFTEEDEVVHQLSNEGLESVIFYGHIVAREGSGPADFVDPPNCSIEASLKPRVLGFGDQTLLTRSNARSFTLRNTGTVALPIVSMTLGGHNRGAFVLSSACGSSVAVGGRCRINVVFSPKTAGAKSASLRVEAGDHIVLTRNLTGTGVKAP